MNWYPNKRLGLLCGLGLLLALGLADYLLVRRMVGSPIDLVLFGRALLLAATLPLVGFVAYVYCGLANLTYRVERNGIAIRWAAACDMVPVEEIQEIVPLTVGRGRLVGGIGWPGYRVGRARVKGVGWVRVYVTRPERSVLVRTRQQAYLISPVNVEGFLADYRARRTLGSIARWTQGQRLPALLRLSIWRDRLAGLLALTGLALNLSLFGYLAAHYQGLAPVLTLSYGPQGLADRIGARAELFLLPGIGLAILLLNGLLAAWVHRRGRVLALLLLGNGPLVQALVWVAAWRL